MQDVLGNMQMEWQEVEMSQERKRLVEDGTAHPQCQIHMKGIVSFGSNTKVPSNEGKVYFCVILLAYRHSHNVWK